MFTRFTVAAFAAFAALLATASAAADAYPSKVVRIVTAGAGGFHDLVSRHLAQQLSDRWGQPVIVENRVGAGLTIATGLVARSAPDGYTLLMGDRTSLAAAPGLYRNLAYDPAKDLAPVVRVALAPMMLVAHPSLPASTLGEFIDYARRQPGGLNVTSAGQATAVHMATEQLNQAAGLNLVSIHYNGAAPAALAIVSGEVKAGFALLPNALPHVASGKLKAYMVTGEKRFARAPDVPTADQAGLRNFASQQWIGLMAPARTPSDIIERINRDVVQIVASPAMQELLVAQGAEPAPGTPAEFGEFIRSESVKLRHVIESTNMRAE